MWGWSLGSMVGNAIDPPIIKGPSVGEVSQQTSQEGVPIPIPFGTSPPLAGNLSMAAPPRIVRDRQSGKGGPKYETETIYRTYAINFCEGPVAGFKRVWRNNVKVYDVDDPLFNFGVDFSEIVEGATIQSRNSKFLQKARFFLGTYDQDASPDLEAEFGVGTTPAHRGIAYMVIVDEDTTTEAGVIPYYQAQINGEPAVPPMILAFARDISLGQFQIHRSSDAGVTWEIIAPTGVVSGSSRYMNSVAYSTELERLVAVSMTSTPTSLPAGGVLYYSDDRGETWTGVANPFSAAFPTTVIWSNVIDKFVCVASPNANNTDAQFIATSADGITWSVKSPTTDLNRDYGKPIFEAEGMLAVVASGSESVGGESGEGVYRSTDGDTWTLNAFSGSSERAMQNKGTGNVLPYSPILEIAVAGVQNIRCNYVQYNAGAIGGAYWSHWVNTAGANFGSMTVCLARNPFTDVFTTGGLRGVKSTNGISWSFYGSTGAAQSQVNMWDSINSQFICGLASGDTSLQRSTDGETWTPLYVPDEPNYLWTNIISIPAP